ncbi:MAG: PhzF family phenazine biosynthesis protein [Planctomyces sp.]|nr:PhzF family phenazine biosynthesis protein [Planctomyces sp.]
MSTPIPIFHVDAFASAPFTGNPAAVCITESQPDSNWMQKIASEMNLSETAFVYPDDDSLRLRWMTPTVEVDLCGHATLATAHVLKELQAKQSLPEFLSEFWKSGMIQFASRSGTLTAEFSSDCITLDFPATQVAPGPLPDGITDALGLRSGDIVFCGRSRFDLLLQVQSAQIVRSLRPSMQALAECPVRGIIVTATGDLSDHDFISRFFAPASGVPEDPVTGSAHCALGPYWAPHFGRSTLFGYQASARGGRIRVDVRGDRVRLGGNAVIVSRGTLEV